MADHRRETDSGDAVLVPVGRSVTLRNTVARAVETAVDDGLAEIHFVAPVPWHDVGDVPPAAREKIEDLLERVAVWAREDAPEGDLTVTTAIIGVDEYLFSPEDYADVLGAYADDHGIDRLIVDPEYSPGGNVPLLQPMETALRRRGFEVTEAPSGTPVRRGRLTRGGGGVQFGLLFGISFVFYQLLGGFTILTGDTFDLYYELTTGILAAGIVAGMLYRISISDRLRFGRLAVRLVRLGLFVPYLVYEIIKSNIFITYLILHPKLPIDPRMTRVRVAVWGGPALTTLANSITLTPGTLTVRAEGQYLYVHGLFASARGGLADGSLERAVRFVFYGRRAAAIAGPEERGDYELLQRDGEDSSDESDGGDR